MDRNADKYEALNKTIRKKIRKDIRNHNTQLVHRTITDNANMRVLRSKMAREKVQISKMENEQGKMVTNKSDIVAVIEGFYRRLYSTSIPKPDHMMNERRQSILNMGSEEIPEIGEYELRATLGRMRNNRAPGEDRITSEMLKMRGAKHWKRHCSSS